MKLLKKTAAFSFGLYLCLVNSTFANTWEDFKLHNESNHAIKSFQTDDGKGSKYGKNWLSSNLKPGQVRGMRFNKWEGPCEVNFKVISVDGFVHEYSADFCTTTDLYIDDQAATTN